jgi:HEAT repeat protein/energy-coupling factor transporter ATP-binding protein EcfA2
MPVLWNNWAKKLRELGATAAPGLLYAQYRNKLADQLGLIEAPGYARPLNLKEVFVPPQFSLLTGPSESSSPRQLDYQHVLPLSPRLLLLGRPGTGKTTFLKYLAVLLAKDEFPRPLLDALTVGLPHGPLDHLVPLFASLPEFAYSAQELMAYLVQVMARYGFENAQAFLTDKLRTGECLLLLDELDKVKPEDERQQVATPKQVATQIQQLVIEFPDNRFIVTTSPGELDSLLPSFTIHVELLGIAENQVPLLVQKYSGDQPGDQEAFRAAVERSQSLRSLATNPRFCTALAAALGREGQVPVRYPWLLQEAVRVLLQVNTLPVPLATAEAVLQELAQRLHTTRQHVFTEDDFMAVIEGVLVATDDKQKSGAQLLEALREPARLIFGTPARGYAFAYPALQEHFTARALVANGQALSALEHAGDPWWDEVIVQVARLQEDATELITALWFSAAQSPDRLFLASRCLAESLQAEASLREPVLDALLGLFEREEADLWPAAARAVAGLVGQDVEKTFLTLAQDPRPERREQAMWALGRIAAEWTVQPLTAALLDAAWPVRRRAAWGLRCIRDARTVRVAVQPIISLLGDEVAAVQQEAVETLDAIGEPAVLPLIQSLDHPKERVRPMAVAALVRIGTPAIGLLIKALGDEREEVREAAKQALAAIGEAALEPLVAALQALGGQARIGAIRSLAQIGGRPAAKALVQLLKVEDEATSEEAAQALMKMGEPAVRPLIEAYEDENRRVRERVERTLWAIGYPAAAALVEDLADERRAVLSRAMQLLQKLGDLGQKALVDSLEDPLTTGRQAVRIIQVLAESKAVKALVKALHHRDPQVRQAAVAALATLAKSRVVEPGIVVESLIEVFQHADEQVQQTVIAALAEIGGRQAAKALTGWFEGSPGLRLAILDALEQIGDKETITFFLQLVGHQDVQVRVKAVEMLGAVRNDQAMDALVRFLADSDQSVREKAATALSGGGDAAVDPLLRAIYDKDKGNVRAQVIAVLGDLVKKPGREPTEKLRLAESYYRLLTCGEAIMVRDMLNLLSRFPGWTYAYTLRRTLQTIEIFGSYLTLQDIAEAQTELIWLPNEAEWISLTLRDVLKELNPICGEIKRYFSSSLRDERMAALAEAGHGLHKLEEKIEHELYDPERTFFRRAAHKWEGIVQQRIRELTGHAQLELRLLTARIPALPQGLVTLELDVLNTGNATAREVRIRLNPSLRGRRQLDVVDAEALIGTLDIIGNKGLRSHSGRCGALLGGPRAAFSSEVMQPARNLHHQIIKLLFRVTKNVLDNATPLDPGNHVLHHDADPGDQPVVLLLLGGKLFAPRLLLGLPDIDPWGCIALESRILIERALFGKGWWLFVADLLVVFLALVGATQILHLAPREGDNHIVLNGMGLLLATVILLLFFVILGTLTTTFRPIQPQSPFCALRQLGSQRLRVPFGQVLHPGQSRPQNLTEDVNPLAGLPLAHPKLEPQHLLQGVGLEVAQNEQQPVLNQSQYGFATTSWLALPFLFVDALRFVSLPGGLEVNEQLAEL